MTRDEAQQKLCNVTGDGQVRLGILDVLESLGLLTFDKPKGPRERAVDAMFAKTTGGMITPRHALQAILDAGLDVVEK